MRDATEAEMDALAVAGGISGNDVLVWDEARDCAAIVTRQEAAGGMLRYARSPGEGSPACGEWSRKALAVIRREDERQDA